MKKLIALTSFFIFMSCSKAIDVVDNINGVNKLSKIECVDLLTDAGKNTNNVKTKFPSYYLEIAAQDNASSCVNALDKLKKDIDGKCKIVNNSVVCNN
ncbi:MAG: hypothetical protein AABZ74_11025 [Cyanobacteriota bacterium]